MRESLKDGPDVIDTSVAKETKSRQFTMTWDIHGSSVM